MMENTEFDRLTVLVIEDNRHFRTIIRTILRGFGVGEVFDVSDAIEAFALLKERDIDLIFLDLDMPVLDGFEFIELVRRAPDSPNTTIPIVILSSHAQRSVVIRAIECGANDFLLKPVRSVDIYRRLKKVKEDLEGKPL